MKLKLLIVFIGVLVILLMAGLEIVQGEDIGYPAPIDEGYPVGYPVDIGYPIDYGYPEPLPGYPIDEGYQILFPWLPVGYPVELEAVNNPVIPDSSIEPQYRNGRNLWQEIVYQFSRLLELMK